MPYNVLDQFKTCLIEKQIYYGISYNAKSQFETNKLLNPCLFLRDLVIKLLYCSCIKYLEVFFAVGLKKNLQISLIFFGLFRGN